MNDDLFDAMVGRELNQLPPVLDQPWPLAKARWYQGRHQAGPLKSPRHTLRIVLGSFAAGVCAALSIASSSVSPVAWSHSLASAFSRCGTDFKQGAFLACPLEVFHQSNATATSSTARGGAGSTTSGSGSVADGSTGPGSSGSHSGSGTQPTQSATGTTSPTPAPSTSAAATPAPTAMPTATPTPSSSCAVASPAGTDLISNSSFETGVIWGGYNSKRVVVQTCAPDGKYVEQVTYNPVDSKTCLCYGTNFTAITNTQAGLTYHAVAWVKAASASAATKRAYLTIREYHNGAYLSKTTNTYVQLSTSGFQKIAISGYVTQYPGDTLNIQVTEEGGTGASSGDSFYVDNVELFQG